MMTLVTSLWAFDAGFDLANGHIPFAAGCGVLVVINLWASRSR